MIEISCEIKKSSFIRSKKCYNKPKLLRERGDSVGNINQEVEKLDQALLAKLDQVIAGEENPSGSLMHILHEAQNLFGYLSHPLQYYIAKKCKVSTARINGIVTFYSFFIEEPNGKYTISVCMGTACFVRGAAEVLERFRTELGFKKTTKISEDGLFSLNEVRCIGACGLAPVVRINDKIYGRVKPEDVPGIIREIREKEGMTV